VIKAAFDRKALLEAFTAAASVIPARSPRPITLNVKAIAESGGVTLMATDTEIGVRCPVRADVSATGEILIPAQRMLQMLKANQDDTITIAADGDKVSVKSRKSKLMLVSDDPTFFPDVPVAAHGSRYEMDAAILGKAIRRAVIATNPNDTRYAMGGILFEPSGGIMTLAGTDSRRISVVEVPLKEVGDPDPPRSQVIVPVNALKLLAKVAAESDEGSVVEMSCPEPSYASFRIPGKVSIYARLIEGRFPPYRRIIPESYATSARVLCGPLLSAVNQAAVATSAESQAVVLSFSGEAVRVHGRAADVGDSSAEVPASIEGDSVEVIVNHRYLADALGLVDGDEEIQVDMNGPGFPMVVRANGEFTHVLLTISNNPEENA
jgi:DNA polymerase-3 subunit beta